MIFKNVIQYIWTKTLSGFELLIRSLHTWSILLNHCWAMMIYNQLIDKNNLPNFFQWILIISFFIYTNLNLLHISMLTYSMTPNLTSLFFFNIFPLNCKIIKKLKISKRLHDNIILKIVLFIIMILSQCNVRQSGGIRQDNQPPRQLTPNKDNLPPNEGNSPSW